jgi:hypothetical protein
MKGIACILVVCLGAAAPALAQGRCAQARDLRLVIYRFHARRAQHHRHGGDDQDGKFTAVGRGEEFDPCTRTIDLGGRTVVPGLIDNHNHIVLLGMRPGHDIRLETAASIADVQSMLRAKAATVPRGEFITTLGDWNAKQFAEKRAPTLAELDAALPQHPYIMNGSGTIVNSLAKKHFEEKGIVVTPDGVIAGPASCRRSTSCAPNNLRRQEARHPGGHGLLERLWIDDQRGYGRVHHPGHAGHAGRRAGRQRREPEPLDHVRRSWRCTAKAS